MALIASLIASTVAFFAAVYFAKRYMDDTDIPKGMTRSITIFTIAAAVSYGVGWLVSLV